MTNVTAPAWIDATAESSTALQGERFGSLIARRFAGRDQGGRDIYQCECNCGETIFVDPLQLGSRHDRSKLPSHCKGSHGLSGLPEFEVWKGIRKRCNNEKCKAWKNYGGRGVRVCEGFGDFVTFFNAVGPRPTDTHKIDRADNDGHYSCGQCQECIASGWSANCRWLTNKENCRNTRKNVPVTINGETKCISEWAEVFGIDPSTVWQRINRFKWDATRALTEPAAPYERNAAPEEEIVAFYLAGHGLQACKRQFGFSTNCIRRVLVGRGVAIRSISEQQALEFSLGLRRQWNQG